MSTKKKKSFLNLLFSVDQFKKDLESNKDLYKKLKDEDKRSRIKETFEESVIRLDLSEEDLENKKVLFRKNANLFYIISLITLITSITLYFYNPDNYIQFLIIMPIISIYLFLLGFRFSFNRFQIEQRKLACLKDFIKKPKKWL